MLVVPVSGKISWRNPPFVTILLILMNCFIFFSFQGEDDVKYYQAYTYYDESGLADIELRHYLLYARELPDNDHKELIKSYRANNDPKARGELLNKLISDGAFAAKLRNNEIITPSSPDFAKWRKLRDNFENKLNESITYKYGFKPAAPDVVDIFSHMFLHGGFGHLFGNMVFLWLVGCMVEAVCLRGAYFFGYILTGIASVLFFGFVYSSSMTPLVGASGAISGLMGAYCLLFGLKKVKVFYSLGFYFNHTKLPAIVLLPFWIGKEIYQLYTLGEFSNVAYIAHLGGLIAGGLIAFAYIKVTGPVTIDDPKVELQDKINKYMEKGFEFKSQLNLNQAREMFEEVLELKPLHHEALTSLFTIEKLDTKAVSLHKTATRLLSLLLKNKADHNELVNTYFEYKKLAGQPNLPPELLVRLHNLFIGKGRLKEAIAIMSMLLKKHPQIPQLPATLLHLSQACAQNQQFNMEKKCLTLLSKKYPRSSESSAAKARLTELS